MLNFKVPASYGSVIARNPGSLGGESKITGECVFCNLAEEEIICENDLARAFYDIFPVNEGHSLVIPRRHVTGFFEATPDELAAINELAFTVREILDKKHNPDGYNIGFNVGAAAGQTVFHLHMHIIPRYRGDVPDPRGGIRKVKGCNARYPGSLKEKNHR